jgi:hypothetical protein
VSNEVKIKISGDAKEFEAAQRTASRVLNTLNKDVLDFSKVAKGAFESFLGNLSANAVTGAFNALKSGFTSAINLAGQLASAASIQEDAIDRLNVSLAQSGKFSKEASQSLQEFASQLQASSRFGDEVILKNAAIIQSLGRLDTDGLKRATQAAADFAAATGRDFDTVSNLIGRAASGQVEALKRYGIEVERTGDKTKDFNLALIEIEKRFGGAALASTNNYAGALAQAQNAFGDIGEEIGAIITQNPIFIAALKGATDAFTFLSSEVKANKGALIDFVADGVKFFVSGISSAGDAVNFFIDIGSGFKAFNAEITDLLLATGQGFVNFAKTIVDTSVSVTDFFGVTTEAQAQAQRSLATSVQVFEEARRANEEKVLSEIASNESLKESISSITQRVEDEIQKRIAAEEASGAIEKELLLNKINERAAIESEDNAARLAFQAEFNEQFKAQQALYFGEEQAALTEQNLIKLAGEQRYNDALAKLRDARAKASQKEIQLEQQKQNAIVGIAQASSNFLQAIDNGKNKAIFLAQKALAAAQVIIQGQTAASAALAPPPLGAGPIAGAGLASLINTKTAISLATIAAQTFTGAFNGALVEGGSPFSDSQPFLLSKGEIVAPRKDFDDVVEGTARQRGFVKSDEVTQPQPAPAVVNITGPVIGTQEFVNDLIEQIRDAVQFRNADLGVR